MRRHLLIPAALALTLTLLIPTTALAWSNGPDDGAGYGTHDWVLDEALDLVSAPWVDRDVALSTTHWPDMVYGSGDVMNHVFKPDGDGRGGPQTVADRYYDLVTAYKAGDYAEASRQLGLLSHYFSDLAVVYHVQTTDGDATEAAEHLQYELDVDSNHRKPGNVSDWITPTSRVTVTDIRKKTVDLAVATRGTYSSLRTAYKANGLSGTALTITKQNLSRAVNGLADIIAAVPSGAGVSGPGTLTASARKLYVANNLNVAMYADCVDSAGNPLEGVRVEFTWPLKAGTVTDIEFTDATGRATSWVILGNETLGEKIEVTASATSGGQTSSDSAVVIPTDVIDYIKTGISNYAPWQNTQVTAHVVCLNADGEPIPDLPVTFTWTHSSTTVVYKTTTNRFGLAWHRRSIGMASTDYRVRVDAVVEAGNTIRSNYATFLPQANPTASPFSPSGVSGDNRYATSATISRRAFPNGASTVVIATGRNFPDALGGAALGGAYDGPILLTEPTALSKEVSDEIKRLGATAAIILGGKTVVGTPVETMLKSAGIKTITRVAGSNRYSTARLVAQAAIKKANGGWDGTALVATGRNFPDALAGSSLAANRLWPIYLADPDAAPSVLAANMKADGVRRVIILGGTSAVSSPYESALEAAIPDTVRLSGADRYATGVEIVRYGVTSAGLVWDGMSVATGANFPDALAGGMLAAKKRSLIVLTSGTALTPCVRTELEQAANEIGTVYYLGGTGALSSAVRNEIDATLR